MGKGLRLVLSAGALLLCLVSLTWLAPYWAVPVAEWLGREDPSGGDLAPVGGEAPAPAPVPRTVLSAEEIKLNPLSGYMGLTDAGRAGYDMITAGFEAYAGSVSLEGLGLTGEDLSAVLAAVEADCPQYFYPDVTAFYNDPYTGEVTSVEIAYAGPPELIAPRREQAEAWRAGVLASAPQDLSNADLALWLHDWLVGNLSYSAEAENNQNILSVIDTGTSVCAGYTKAYAYLLQGAGIFAIYVPGGIEGEAHAWNLVQIDGEYGWIDTTWDDPSFAGSDYSYVSHIFYGLGTEELKVDHVFENERPEYAGIGQPSFNYFVSKGMLFDLDSQGSFEVLSEITKKAKESGGSVVEARMADAGQVNLVVARLMFAGSLIPSFFEFTRNPDHPVVTFFYSR